MHTLFRFMNFRVTLSLQVMGHLYIHTSPKSFLSFFSYAFNPSTSCALTHLLFTTSFEKVTIIFLKRKVREMRSHMT